MEYSFEKMLFLIESMRRANMSGVKIHYVLETAWPAEAVSLRQVQRLMKDLTDGTRQTFSHISGQGRQISDQRQASIELVRQAIETDSTLTERRLARMLHMNDTMVHRILNEDLEMLWIKTQWVPHKISEVHRQLRVERCQDMLEAFHSRIVKNNLVIVDEKWFFGRYLRPRNSIGSWISPHGDGIQIQTPKRLQTEKKFLVSVAVTISGQHYFKIADDNIDSDSYIQFIKEMAVHFRNSAGIQMENMCLIQDNARPHVSRATLAFLGEKNIRLLKQPPYSPDTNMCDRFIFCRLESLRGQENPDFSDREELELFLSTQLPTFTGEMMRKEFQKMREDFGKIIANEGHYLK